MKFIFSLAAVLMSLFLSISWAGDPPPLVEKLKMEPINEWSSLPCELSTTKTIKAGAVDTDIFYNGPYGIKRQTEYETHHGHPEKGRVSFLEFKKVLWKDYSDYWFGNPTIIYPSGRSIFPLNLVGTEEIKAYSKTGKVLLDRRGCDLVVSNHGIFIAYLSFEKADYFPNEFTLVLEDVDRGTVKKMKINHGERVKALSDDGKYLVIDKRQLSGNAWVGKVDVERDGIPIWTAPSSTEFIALTSDDRWSVWFNYRTKILQFIDIETGEKGPEVSIPGEISLEYGPIREPYPPSPLFKFLLLQRGGVIIAQTLKYGPNEELIGRFTAFNLQGKVLWSSNGTSTAKSLLDEKSIGDDQLCLCYGNHLWGYRLVPAQ